MAIDHSLIDEQHRDLFIHTREFVEAVKTSKNYSQLRNVLEFMDKYIQVHFRTEERLMAQKNYPFLQMQVDQHRRFSRYFDGLRNEIKRNFETNRIFILFRIQVLIVDWLINHTSKLDLHFGKFLRYRKGRGLKSLS